MLSERLLKELACSFASRANGNSHAFEMKTTNSQLQQPSHRKQQCQPWLLVEALITVIRSPQRVDKVKFNYPIDKCNFWKLESEQKKQVFRHLSSKAATIVAPRETQPLEWIIKLHKAIAGVMNKQCPLLGVIHRLRRTPQCQRLLPEQCRRLSQRQCRKHLLDLASTLQRNSTVKDLMDRQRSSSMIVVQAITDRDRRHLQS